MESGPLMRAAREAAGISLREMAKRTYYSRAYLSLIETGQRPIPARVASAYARVLNVDIERLTTVAREPAKVDIAALSDVGTILAATRRFEDAAGALTVLPAVRGMAEMVEVFADEARSARSEASAAIASEVVQYRGWLEHAIGADSAARRSLGTAIGLAKASREPDRVAHSVGFLGYVTVSTGNYAEVLALSDAALAVRGAHPVVRAYGYMRRAELLAEHGDPSEAQPALHAADAATEAADGLEPPASMYWWSTGFGAVQRGGVLALLGRTAEATAEAEQGVAAMPAEHRRSEWLASALRRVDPDMSVDSPA